jgi:hypothetical protein
MQPMSVFWPKIANASDILQLEDLSIGHPLLPLGDPRLRAHCRLWTDHVSPTRRFDPFLSAADPPVLGR